MVGRHVLPENPTLRQGPPLGPLYLGQAPAHPTEAMNIIKALQQTGGMIRFWDSRLTGAPPLLGGGVRRPTVRIPECRCRRGSVPLLSTDFVDIGAACLFMRLVRALAQR